MNTSMICAKCGTIGAPNKAARGGCLVELALWLFFLIQGLIYSIWRRTGPKNACPSCGSTDMVPIDSPVGKELSSKYRQ